MPRTFAETHRRTITPEIIGRTVPNREHIARVLLAKERMRTVE